MTEPIRGSEVFWEAALDLFEEKEAFCCNAIGEIRQSNPALYEELSENKVFAFLFRPEKPYSSYCWMCRRGNRYQDDKDREHRVWAMLFMEQIWRDEYE